jgi:hypothetical protein
MSREWQQYEGRYSLRPETYAAYVDVWNRLPEARQEFSGWASFSQAANAEPAQVVNKPDRVHVAERIMRRGGYELGPPTRRGARRWQKALESG